MKRFKAAFMCAILVAQITAMLAFAQAPSSCTITGTIYKSNLQPAASTRIQILKTVLPNGLMLAEAVPFYSNASGVVTITAPQGSTIYLYGPVAGLDVSGGKALAVPSSSTASLESLVAVAAVPTAGLTVKDEGTALTNLVGTFNFTGAGVTAAQASPGVATINISAGSGTVSSVGLSLPAIFSVSGSPVTTTGTLTGTLANQSANLFFAGPSSGSATAPTFRAIAAGDIPSGLDALKIADGSVSNAEFQYLDGVTSSIQTQLSGKQASNANLSAIAGLTSGADKLPYFTGSGAAALADFSPLGRSLVDDANAAAARSTLGLVIGTDVQAQGNYITALTGEVTATGPGSVAAAIANDAVTFAKMQNISTLRLLGRTTAGTGDIEQISVGSGLALAGGVLSATSSGITNSAGADAIPKSDGTNLIASRITDDGGLIQAQSLTFVAGDYNGEGNHSYLDIDDPGMLVTLQSMGQVIMGDGQGFGSGTKLIIDDGNTAVTGAANTIILGKSNNGSNKTTILLDDTAQTIKARTTGIFSGGDVDGFGNGTKISVDDSTQSVELSGDIKTRKTITSPGTTGARTINTTAGSVNFAAAAASLVVTNNLVSTSSVIICTVASNDGTMKSAQCVAGSGSFTIYANAAPTGETRVNFLVIN